MGAIYWWSTCQYQLLFIITDERPTYDIDRLGETSDSNILVLPYE